tara:strand:+ start:896 stop:1117 length:222 start_codon:yes stop_codon:yes gene_type:complete
MKKKSSWDWYCNSKEAIEHQKNCKNRWNCDQCQWIDASSGAMEDHGTEVEPDPVELHPLFDEIMETFNGREID